MLVGFLPPNGMIIAPIIIFLSGIILLWTVRKIVGLIYVQMVNKVIREACIYIYIYIYIYVYPVDNCVALLYPNQVTICHIEKTDNRDHQ